MSYDNFPVAVVDNGGQWTHREYRVLNYLGCRAEIVSNVTPISELERFKALVLSGGAPRIETESEALGLTSEYIDAEKWPILGICVGHQYIHYNFWFYFLIVGLFGMPVYRKSIFFCIPFC